METLDLLLPTELTAPAQARQALRTLPAPPSELHDLELLTTELVASTVTDARFPRDGTIEIHVVMLDDLVRIEVRDAGPFSFHLQTQMDQVGLYIVDHLATRSGTLVSPHGCVMWAEYERSEPL